MKLIPALEDCDQFGSDESIIEQGMRAFEKVWTVEVNNSPRETRKVPP